MNTSLPSKEELARVRTRASLLARLKNLDDGASWREFFDVYWRLIYRFALKKGLTETEADEVLQDAVIVVARKMPDFDYDPARGRFSTWLFTITGFQVKKHFALRNRQHQMAVRPEEGDDGVSPLEQVPDPNSLEPDAAWETEWKQNLMDVATERAKRKANPQDYQRFDYHVIQGHTPDETARDLGCAVNTVYSAKRRVGEIIKEEVARLREKLF